MKKILIIMMGLYILIPLKAYAVDEYSQQLDEITEEYNLDISLYENFSFKNVADYITDNIKDKIERPFELAIKLIAIVFLYSVAKSVYSDDMADSVYDNICVLIVFTNLLSPLRETIGIIIDNLFQIKNFMVAFLPVYSGISFASGEFLTSTIYTGLFLTSVIAVSNMCITFILPSIEIYFAIIVSDTLSSFVRLKSLGEFYIKIIKTIMKTAVSVICFMLTLQTTISHGKDTLAVKAGKLISGGAIPVIGSALQDAIGSVYAGMEAIKGYAGAIGISAVVAVFVPSLISLTIYWLCTNFIHIIADIFDAVSLKKCLSGFIQAIELIIAVVILFMIMMIFSFTVMISITNGA